MDGFQYVGGELNFFQHAEGYVNVTLGTTGNRIFNYVYYYTDHLGNIRLTYTKDMVSNELKIMDENHYYPFGLKHQKYSPAGSLDLKAQSADIARPGYATSTPFMYKYNGKELQDELGLNMYDMDMRLYDPAIARWVVLDPVIHHSMSPYNAFDNNPVFWADPSGADSIFSQGGTSYSSITTATGGSVSAGGAGDNNTSNENKTSATSVTVDANGNRTVTTFEHTYEGTNTGGNLGDDIISFMQAMYDSNGNMTQLTTSLVIVNQKGDISSKNTTATTKGEGGKWQSTSSDSYAYGLDNYATAVSNFKSYDQTSPLQYQAKLNREYNKGEGKAKQAQADAFQAVLSAASSRIPYVGPAASSAIKAVKVDMLKGEHADQIGVKVVKEGQHKPSITFSNESTW